MIWLSHLHPKRRGLARRARERRRLMINLEALENRTVLSAVTASFNATTSALSITGDTFNDNFTITENSDGTVTVAPGATRTVPGLGTVTGSLINGSGASGFDTHNPVVTISVTLPGTSQFRLRERCSGRARPHRRPSATSR